MDHWIWSEAIRPCHKMLFHYCTQNDVPVHTAEILMSNWGLKLQCEHRHTLCLSHEHMQAPNTLGLRTSLLHFNEPLPPADSNHGWNSREEFQQDQRNERTCRAHLLAPVLWLSSSEHLQEEKLAVQTQTHLTLSRPSHSLYPKHQENAITSDITWSPERNFMDPGPHQNCLKI
jgi:hypothetical protein